MAFTKALGNFHTETKYNIDNITNSVDKLKAYTDTEYSFASMHCVLFYLHSAK